MINLKKFAWNKIQDKSTKNSKGLIIRHISSDFATFRQISQIIATNCQVAKYNDMWRNVAYYLFFIDKIWWRHNFILCAPQCATIWHIFMWHHLAPQNATIRHVGHKLQMNVFRSINSKSKELESNYEFNFVTTNYKRADEGHVCTNTWSLIFL